YTLYMHLAPYSAYQKEETTPVWKLQNTLNAYPTIWREQLKTPRSTTLAKGTLVEWSPEKSETKLTITKNNQLREYGLVTVKSNKGNNQQVWILVDNNNLIRHDENDITPSWWKGLRSAPAQDVMEFDKVVSLNTPITIKAGDSLGHMGFYQAPKEQGVESRYQVHIECFSHDDNLPQFLKNPDAVGINDPYYLKCLPGLMLWEKNEVGEFVKTERKTTWESLHKLSELKLEIDKQQQKYYFLPEHLGYFPKQIDISDTDKDKIGSLTKRVEEIQADETKQAEYQNITQHALFLSRYDLEKIGFRALTSETTTFDYLNGYIQPKATYISAIFDIILAEANVSPRPEKGIIAHNYQRLINKIKGSATEHYNPEEYRRAFHNPMFSHLVNKAIVKHPSDWYYQSHDNVWQSFLKILSEEAPLWRSYSEEFLDNMIWMQDVTNEKLGPEVWHMHPLIFLDQFIQENIVIGKITGKKFVEYVFEQAKINEKTSNIPAAITTAQAILETGYGKSVPADINTGKYSYNIFGIKAHGDPNYVEVYTHEVIDGKRIKIIDKFQAYSSYEESIKGRENFFIKNKRYHFLFNTKDPIEWANGLQKAGYATDPNYAKTLIAIMRSQNLL
ncbi:TPA: glucosaminidase domain-containing protein, partial [Proteus mirabilis]|nr:glucosaminidase domain-containing protein [Proteus mirabilis]